jgi:hypothetical protein
MQATAMKNVRAEPGTPGRAFFSLRADVVALPVGATGFLPVVDCLQEVLIDYRRD